LSFPAARVVVTDREFAFWTSPLSRKPLFIITGGAPGSTGVGAAKTAYVR
jgi:hypothetical protein